MGCTCNSNSDDRSKINDKIKKERKSTIPLFPWELREVCVNDTDKVVRRVLRTIRRDFAQIPGFERIGKGKPQSTEDRIASINRRRQGPSALLSLFVEAERRATAGDQGTNEFETSLITLVNSFPESVKKRFAEVGQAAKLAGANNLIKPIDGSLTSTNIARILGEDIRSHLPRLLPYFPTEYATAAGKVRRCISDVVEVGYCAHVTPTICSINSLRRAGHNPAPVPWEDQELQRECDVVEGIDGMPVFSCNAPRTGTPESPCEAGATRSSVCLTIPIVSPGTTITIKGYNFISKLARVRLTHITDSAAPARVLDARVIGDGETPTTEMDDTGQSQPICDCRVQDVLYFDMPRFWDANNIEEVKAGDYRIQLEFKNPDSYVDLRNCGSGTAPEWLSSNSDVLRIAAPETYAAKIVIEDVICDDDSGGLGTDDLLLRAFPFGINFPDPTTPLPTARFGEVEMNSRQAFADNPPPGYARLGSGSPNIEVFSGLAPDILVIGVLGFEVEDSALAEAMLTDFGDALVHAIEWIRENILTDEILPLIAEGAGELVSALGAWGVLILVIVVIVTFVIMTVWAAISVPDVLIQDFITLSRDKLFFMTHPTNPMPEITANEFGEDPDRVTVTATGIRKLENDYWEERLYRNDEGEDSTYRLNFRYSRIG